MPREVQLISIVDKRIDENSQKRTYAQAMATRNRMMKALSRTAINGSPGGARNADTNIRKLAF